jgi:hypothetical protein
LLSKVFDRFEAARHLIIGLIIGLIVSLDEFEDPEGIEALRERSSAAARYPSLAFGATAAPSAPSGSRALLPKQ